MTHQEDENETVFLVFFKSPSGIESFHRVFYTHKDAQKYCDKNKDIFPWGYFEIREEEIT
jgi:hypothetical protein